MRTRFSIGNRKLSKNVIIWNLPIRATCPGAGECESWCYENKIERMYKNTGPFRHINLALSKTPSFVDNVVKFLNGRKEEYVRIHASGDFYNQRYLNKWKKIASKCPSKLFYCFTKSFHLDLWTNTPRNMQIMQSTGSKFDFLIDWSRATNRVAMAGSTPPVGITEVKCSGKGCGSTCTLCIGKSNIHLMENLHK